MPAPIVLFTYSRPDKTRNILNSLWANAEAKDSVLYIYCDGPKSNASAEMVNKIEEVRSICKNENRFKKVIVKEQPVNKGLADSIIDGVTEVINMHGSVIVLEDDLVLSPYFLMYMNDSLERYEKSLKVGQIGACNYYACGKKYPTAFFLPIPDCWGWATWKDRWSHFKRDPAALHDQLIQRDLIYRFNGYGSYPMESLLIAQKEGQRNSWAVLWTGVCVLNNWLTLYPNPSVTNHIESQEATNANFNMTPPLYTRKPVLKTIEVIEDPVVVEAMKRGMAGTGDYYGNLKKENTTPFFKRLIKFLMPGLVKLYKMIKLRYNTVRKG